MLHTFVRAQYTAVWIEEDCSLLASTPGSTPQLFFRTVYKSRLGGGLGTRLVSSTWKALNTHTLNLGVGQFPSSLALLFQHVQKLSQYTVASSELLVFPVQGLQP